MIQFRFGTGRALLLHPLLLFVRRQCHIRFIDSGWLDTDTYYADCYCYYRSYSICPSVLINTDTDTGTSTDLDTDNNNDSDTVPSNSTTTSTIATALNGPTVYVHLPII